MPKTLLAVAAALALLAVPAAAHITVTVDPLEAPLQVGVPTNVTVRFSEPCAEFPVEIAAGNDALTAALADGAPAYVSAVGETVPWTIEDCDATAVPLAQVRQTATLTLTIDASAPGLGDVSIPVTYVDANGASAEGVPLNVTIAYHANGTLSAKQPTGHDALHATGTTTKVELTVDYVTNAPSVLSFEASTTDGAIAPLADVAVTPPSFDGKARATAKATALVTPPLEGGSAELTFKAFLAPAAGGAKVPVGVATLRITHEAEGTTTGDHGEHDEDAKDSPAPAFAFVGLGLLAFAAVRRR